MKYIEIDQETDRVLATICDAALKGQGMQAMPLINLMISAIKDK